MIRPARPTDDDVLIAVWLASTIPGQAFLPEAHWRAMEPEIRQLMSTADRWVAEHDGRPVAFVAVIDNLIGGLFTHPDHQGEGHGRALVAHVAEEFDPLFVEVFEANERARRFYARCGFVEHDRHVDPGSGLPALILRMAVNTAPRGSR